MKFENLISVLSISVLVGFGLMSSQSYAMATLPQFQRTLVSPESGGDGKDTWRHVVYGDSILSGYCGLFCSPAVRNAAKVQSEHLSDLWDINIEHQGRCVAGAVAKEIYERMQKDASYMQTADTKVVSFEMCGNDFLRARNHFRNSLHCDETTLISALQTCEQYMALAMDFINENANRNPPGGGGLKKYIMNLYYPGFNTDKNTYKGECGGKSNMDIFLHYLTASNWRACNLARQKGFKCADSFAEFMAADFDTNGDGIVDSKALRYVDGESEASYVHRITVALKETLTDSGMHRWTPQETYDYIQTDDVHPSYGLENRSLYYTNGHNRAGFSFLLTDKD